MAWVVRTGGRAATTERPFGRPAVEPALADSLAMRYSRIAAHHKCVARRSAPARPPRRRRHRPPAAGPDREKPPYFAPYRRPPAPFGVFGGPERQLRPRRRFGKG